MNKDGFPGPTVFVVFSHGPSPENVHPCSTAASGMIPRRQEECIQAARLRAPNALGGNMSESRRKYAFRFLLLLAVFVAVTREQGPEPEGHQGVVRALRVLT